MFIGTEILTQELIPSRGFQSSVDYKLIVGLGKHPKIDSAIITWPDRTTSRFDSLSINKVHIFEQTQLQTVLPKTFSESPVKTIFSVVSSNFEKHEENEFVDFYYERTIPRAISREGPKAATADINGDGLTDIYIGGAEGKIVLGAG